MDVQRPCGFRRPGRFARYRAIGSDGSGNPIAINEAACGEVVYLDHDNRFEHVFMNSSVGQLAHLK